MVINSKYTKQFHSNLLSQTKYNKLYEIAVYLRTIRNQVSEEFNNNLLYYINVSKFDFIKLMRQKFPNISGYFDQDQFSQVYTDYQNRCDALQNKLSFKIRKFQEFTFYKRNCKSGKKGDLKSIKYKNEYNRLTNTLTWLARYGNKSSLSYITKQSQINSEKQVFYQSLLDVINKFTFERLYNLALRFRNRILSKYKYPINYKSLTFSGYSCYIKNKRCFLSYNDNYKSQINSFISLSIPKEFGQSIIIPIKHSNNYHGRISNWKNNAKKYISYKIKFDEYSKQVNILICIDGQRYIPENKTNYIGIDVNVKHNLFACSNGQEFDFDRKLANKLTKFLSATDKKEKTIEEQHKIDKLTHKLQCSCIHAIADACKSFKQQGINHVILENLDQGFKKTYIKNKDFNDINYNRLTHILNIGSLKDKFETIARKYDICVSFIHKDYTSQTCPICGCICEENRLSQENFNCIHCGYSDNADHNAAVNIKNRVVLTVLRDKLLKQLDNGAYKPKKIRHEKFKDALLSCMKKIYGAYVTLVT